MRRTPRSSKLPLVALTLLLSACSGRAIVSTPTDATAATEAAVIAPRVGPVTSIPEAWPEPAYGDADALVDGLTGSSQFAVDASTRLPWTLVMRILDGPVEVAAIGLFCDDPARAISDVSVFSYLGAVPLNRLNYPQFLEGSDRLGIARVTEASGWIVFRFEEITSAHFIWFRVSSDSAGNGVSLSEVRLFSPDELAALAELPPGEVRIVELQPVDTAPYDDLNLLGLPDLGSNTNPVVAPAPSETETTEAAPDDSNPLPEETTP